jgi:prepilin-type N-terminal cleavage/methylation domain-containing protein
MRQRGFTLIELLIVVAMIALLMGILLPSLSKARQSARLAVCESRMRLLGHAMHLYAGDFRNRTPLPNWDAGSAAGDGWLYRVPDGASGLAGMKQDSLRELMTTGQLWPYVRAKEAYHCPEYSRQPAQPDAIVQQISSYIMNGAVCNYQFNSLSIILDRFRSQAIVLWEADETQGGGYWNDGSNRPDEGITSRHRDGGVVACFDGHSEWMSHDKYYHSEINNHPGRLWCSPMSSTGGAD